MVSLTLVYFSILPEPDDVSHSFGLFITSASATGRGVRLEVLVHGATVIGSAVVAAPRRLGCRIPEHCSRQLRRPGSRQFPGQHD